MADRRSPLGVRIGRAGPFAAGALSLVLAACGTGVERVPAAPTTASPEHPPASVMPWADEFDGPKDAPPDPSKWTYDLGNNGGWGNQELETYTDLRENSHLDGEGHLIIRAAAASGGFTSARLKTQGLVAAEYGRVEARIRVPSGRGLWPAFWMLGNSFSGSNWPECGEIDIMEHIGREPTIVRGTVHGPGYSGAHGITAAYVLPGGVNFADDFHSFALEWRPGALTFEVDGVPYHTVKRASLPGGSAWVFDRPFHVLLNVAVGGNYPGPPDSTTQFPQEMVIDYVRYAPLPAPNASGKR